MRYTVLLTLLHPLLHPWLLGMLLKVQDAMLQTVHFPLLYTMLRIVLHTQCYTRMLHIVRHSSVRGPCSYRSTVKSSTLKSLEKTSDFVIPLKPDSARLLLSSDLSAYAFGSVHVYLKDFASAEAYRYAQ